MSQILYAKPVIAHLEAQIKARVSSFVTKNHRTPKLAVVLVGNDPASTIYTSKKGEVAVSLGMLHETMHLPATSTPSEVHGVISELNRDPSIDGILIQRPLPPGFHEEEVAYWVAPEKDVDAFHPENVGRLVLGLKTFKPCTPAGVIELLDFYDLPIAGKKVCVVGRSSIVGKPMASLLLSRDATVIHVHSKTPHLRELTSQADILVVAAGRRSLINGSMIKPGAVVVDVGIHRDQDAKICGDVDFHSASPVCSAITPVPGGVGPMTIRVLMLNTITAAEMREGQ